MSDKPILSETARAALMACFATRGKNKGLLLASAPSSFTKPAEYAAWQGAQMSCNPFKVSIGGMMFMKAEHKAIFEEVCVYLDARPALKKVLDRDRAALEKLGVW